MHGRVTERAEMTDRHQRCRHDKETCVRQDGVADLHLRFAKEPGVQAHGQFPDATADQHASQHEMTAEQSILGTNSNPSAHGERPLWEFATPRVEKPLGDIARARGMTQVAREAGLSRESLYKALSENGNLSFATILKVARALGVRLHAMVA